jgi:hypothetical protein
MLKGEPDALQPEINAVETMAARKIGRYLNLAWLLMRSLGESERFDRSS